MDDRELVRAFESCTLSPDAFTHREHVRLAWAYLREHSLFESLRLFAEGLKRYTASLGKSDRYHETITCAYLFLIHERMQRAGGNARDFDAFAAANEDLFARTPPILARYYRDETLQSSLARATFVMPDAG